MSKRRARLILEPLESRTAPATDSWLAGPYDFESDAVDATPGDWLTWGSDGNAGFRVAGGQSIGGQSLASDGGSSRVGRAWLSQSLPGDVAVTSSILASTLIPTQVIARGRNLDGTTPTYYAASVVRGLHLELLRVVNGATTTLATLRTNSYVSGLWLDVTLIVQGSTIQARVQRRDTGDWLTAFGDWQAGPAAALTVRDAAIPSAGQAGLARSAAVAGTAYFDDLRVAAATGDVTAPRVTAGVRPVSRILKQATVAGRVRLAASVHERGQLTHVEYLIDGTLVARKTARFFTHDFDSLSLANGQHTLTVRAWDAAGNVGTASRSFAVFNRSTLAPPAIPRHFTHIRYAALAYYGLPMTPNEEQLLRSSVDLVVPNARYLRQINEIAPTTPQLIYSNVSNLYLDLLTDWLRYADRTGVPRESAFYHVAQPTPFTGDSPSSMPVTWFWNVQRGPADANTGSIKLTGEARSARPADMELPATGGALYLGYPERFREMRIWLARPAGSGWTSMLEYPTQVDAAGRPVAWRPLPNVNDGTGGLRHYGVMSFDPPADWRPAVVAGSEARLYYVRLRTISGDAAAAPVASTILGRDYVGANGARAGTIPAYDRAADADGDGYLNDAEYARRRSGYDARFEYESRLFYPYYGQMRFVTNPSGNGVAGWAIDYHRRLLANNPLADGLFMDNSTGRAPTNGATLLETTDTYASGFGAMLGAVNRAIAPKWLLANTTGGGIDADRVVRQVPASIEEFALRPLAHNWTQFRDLADSVARRLQLTNPPGYLILDSLATGGSPTDDRTRLAALAYYYLLADPRSTFFMTWGGEEPSSAWSRHWFDAIAFDVGQPVSALAEFAGGADPANSSLTYNVFGRQYDNALVLYKPLSYAAGRGTGGIGDDTATTHQLNGIYRRLNADGTMGPISSAITLRNGEGAILIRA